MERWSIYIDVEGFSSIYARNKTRALVFLGKLMHALFRIGSRAFPNSPDRLFIHQFGDGFVIVSDFSEASAERPLGLAIAVMRHLITKGVATKAVISSGDFGDVLGCYPGEVREVVTDSHHVRIGEGLMTITPVMGMALVTPYKLASDRHGAVLLLDHNKFSSVPEGVKRACANLSVVDWVHSDFPLIETICKDAGLASIDAQSAERHLKAYIESNPDIPNDWTLSTLESVNLDDSA